MEASHSKETKSFSLGGTFNEKRDLKRESMMTKQECIKAMQKTASADGFITMTELCQFIGIKKPEVAERILSDMRYDNERV